MTKQLLRQTGEEYWDYLNRLYENKSEYGLDCSSIASLMNQAFALDCGESKYRKEWKAFDTGRRYERKQTVNGIAKRILSISDLHVPYHLPIETFREYRNSIDILVLNGDLVDHQGISKFPKSYRINPMEELISCRQYLIDLIEYLHPHSVIANYGNHENRFGAYLSKYLDSEVRELMPDSVLELIFEDGFYHYNRRERCKVWYEPIKNLFEDIEITYTKDWKCKIGKAWFAHPIAFSSGTLRTCENAMNYFHKTDMEPFDAVVLAHTHRTGDTRKGSVTLYEQGACCKTGEMNYTDGKLTEPQQQGFVLICQDRNGNLIYEKSRRVII